MRDYLVLDTGLLAMTAKDADRLLVRPLPSTDDAVPNANGVFAEALVRLAQITGDDRDRQLAEGALATLVAIARPAAINHASILNALDLHLRGLTIVVTGEGCEPLRHEALRVPYLDRSVCAPADPAGLDDAHPAKPAAQAGRGPQALVCAGMRCSLPVTEPGALRQRIGEMLGG